MLSEYQITRAFLILDPGKKWRTSETFEYNATVFCRFHGELDQLRKFPDSRCYWGRNLRVVSHVFRSETLELSPTFFFLTKFSLISFKLFGNMKASSREKSVFGLTGLTFESHFFITIKWRIRQMLSSKLSRSFTSCFSLSEKNTMFPRTN